VSLDDHLQGGLVRPTIW